MTPTELREIREATGMGQSEFGRALGYAPDANGQTAYKRFETGKRPVPPLLALLMRMVESHGMPDLP